MSEHVIQAQLRGQLSAAVRAELTSAPPLSTGQAVPGYPNGVKPSTADFFRFSAGDVARIRAKHYTAAIAMHEMDIGWSKLQIQGIKSVLDKFGIQLIGVTNAQFNAATQVSNVDTLLARHPTILFSIPVNPVTEASAYKRVQQSGTKLVLLDNVPSNLAPGRDYVTVVSGNNGGDAHWATQRVLQATGGKGEFGFLGIGYYFFVMTQRDNAAREVLDGRPGVTTTTQTWSDPSSQAANEATGMLIRKPNMQAIWTSYTLPAASVISAERAQNRTLYLATSDLDETSAVQVAQGWITATGAQQPYQQGVAEGRSAVYSLLGRSVPPYIELPTVPVTRSDLIPAYRQVLRTNPPKAVLDALRAEPVQRTF